MTVLARVMDHHVQLEAQEVMYIMPITANPGRLPMVLAGDAVDIPLAIADTAATEPIATTTTLPALTQAASGRVQETAARYAWVLGRS